MRGEVFVEKDPGLLSRVDINGRTVLHNAAHNGHIDVVRSFVEKAAVSAKTEGKYSAAMDEWQR